MKKVKTKTNTTQQKILDGLQQLEDKMSALDDAVTAIQTSVDGISTALDKLTADFNKSIADLQTAIKNGVDPTNAITNLNAVGQKLQAVSTALGTLDASAIAADPANPPPPPSVG